jgi:similar to spore coat protein
MTQSVSTETALSRVTDQVIASDLLIYAKTAVKTYSSAIAESSTPVLRNLLRKHLEQALAFQEQVASYVADRGWYNAYDAGEQLKSDAELTQNTLNLLK